MNKDLSEMSREELWRLFPICVEEPNPEWSKWYQEEELCLISLFYQANIKGNIEAPGFYHVGSTSLNGMGGRAIIDILGRCSTFKAINEASCLLANCGWTVMSSEEGRVSLTKGYTKDGFADRVFHLHLVTVEKVDELYFAELLRYDKEHAENYYTMKKQLEVAYSDNRGAYSEMKTDFVKSCTAKGVTIFNKAPRFYKVLEKKNLEAKKKAEAMEE